MEQQMQPTLRAIRATNHLPPLVERVFQLDPPLRLSQVLDRDFTQRRAKETRRSGSASGLDLTTSLACAFVAGRGLDMRRAGARADGTDVGSRGSISNENGPQMRPILIGGRGAWFRADDDDATRSRTVRERDESRDEEVRSGKRGNGPAHRPAGTRGADDKTSYQWRFCALCAVLHLGVRLPRSDRSRRPSPSPSPWHLTGMRTSKADKDGNGGGEDANVDAEAEADARARTGTGTRTALDSEPASGLGEQEQELECQCVLCEGERATLARGGSLRWFRRKGG